ncbi:MAG: aminotransferase class I/II-fold pyridoxal phosphate-dependent enzyme [Verrucomicrobiota bacterium]
MNSSLPSQSTIPANGSLDALSGIQKWYGGWQDVEEKDVENLSKQLLRGTLTVPHGGLLNQFERKFAQFAGASHCVAFNNGTASLYAALWALGIGPGDEVLACDYGYHGVAAAISTLGAHLVPCDMDPETLALDPETIASRLTTRSKAVLLHHPWGVPAGIEAIRRATDLPIISDASHAHGATHQGKPLGHWADITCYSLGMRKLITGGELGAAVTNNPELRDKMVVLGHVKRAAQDIKTFEWTSDAVGLKLRPHIAGLALATPQIKRFDAKKKRLQATCREIETLFEANGFRPQKVRTGDERVYWRLVFQVPQEEWGDTPIQMIEESLRAGGLPVEPNHYWPLLQHQAPYQWPGAEQKVVPHRCEVAETIVPRLITLPAPVVLPESEMEKVKTAVEATSQRFRQSQQAVLAN